MVGQPQTRPLFIASSSTPDTYPFANRPLFRVKNLWGGGELLQSVPRAKSNLLIINLVHWV